MDLTKILSISGRAGLFKVISQGKNTIIAESLTDQKRIPVFGHEKMSTLEEISVFTTGEDLPLKEILKSIYEKQDKKPVMDPKTSQDKDLKAFFESIVPDYDKERVYTSDIKKILTWYNTLVEKEILDFTEKKSESEPSD
jgi:hypothetical protein